jgi:hypothetical protein
MSRDEREERFEEHESEAAAEEAGSIGGRRDPDEDPAEQAVDEGGGGESEGFELAEEDLVEAASHGDPAPDPTTEAFTPEEESDRGTAEYGEADEEEPDDA